MNSIVKEILSQLGIKIARAGTIYLDDYDKAKITSAGLSETQVINSYRYGEQETPLRYTKVEGKQKVTVVLKQNPNRQEEYHLTACWLSKNWK